MQKFFDKILRFVRKKKKCKKSCFFARLPMGDNEMSVEDFRKI